MLTIQQTSVIVMIGQRVIETVKIPGEVQCESCAEVETHRVKVIDEHRPRICEAYKADHPGEPLPRIDVLLTVRCRDGYARPSKKKSKNQF